MKKLANNQHLLLLTTVTLLLLSTSGFAQQEPVKQPQAKIDVFDELQKNVWYLPTDDKKSRLYVTSIGDKGPVIVTLHGGPGNDFNYLVKPLRTSTNDYKFILFDQRGSLLSPVADSLVKTLSMNVLVDDMETLRKSLGQEKMILFGHSFGTFLAMAYYIKYPQHVKGIILAATLPPYTSSSYTLTDFSKAMAKLQKGLRRRPEVRKLMESYGVLNDTTKVLTQKEKDIRFKIDGLASFNIYNIARWQEFQGGQVYFKSATAQAIGNTMDDIYDIRPSMDKYPVPIYVIQGDKDYVYPSVPFWLDLQKHYPSVRISILKDASHYSWVDDPEEFDRSFHDALKFVTKN